MRNGARAFDACLDGLALVCGALLALIPILIVYDAMLRILGIGASVWTNDFSAIAIVYVTFLAAPWVLREKGHVYVELLMALISWKNRLILGRIVSAVSAVVCAFLAYLSVHVVVANYGLYDVSAIETPRWLRFLPLPFGFLLLAIEFFRSMFDDEQHLPVHTDSTEHPESRSVL